MILEQAHEVLSEATGIKSTPGNSSMIITKLTKMINEISDITLKPTQNLISLGALAGTAPG